MKNYMKKALPVFIILLLFCPAVTAAGMLVAWNQDRWQLQPEHSQLAAIRYENGTEHLLLAVTGGRDVPEGPAVWIVPVPADPEQVELDVIRGFPYFGGTNLDRSYPAAVTGTAAAMAAYVSFPLSLMTGFPFLFLAGTAGYPTTAADSVTIHETVETMGLTSELVAANQTDGLHRYLAARGMKIPDESEDVIREYVGNNYTFVVTSISDLKRFHEEAGIIGVSVRFPAKRIYYPLKPTSVYGQSEIPAIIYVIGHVMPEIPGPIRNNTRVAYYRQEGYHPDGALVPFFNQKSATGSLEYTKITITAPSDAFTEDLWINPTTPADVRFRDFFVQFTFILGVTAFVVFSMFAALCAGILAFRKTPVTRRGLLQHGLWNLLTAIPFIAVTRGSFSPGDAQERSRFVLFFYAMFFEMILLSVVILLPVSPERFVSACSAALSGAALLFSVLAGLQAALLPGTLYLIIIGLIVWKLYRWAGAEDRAPAVVRLPFEPPVVIRRTIIVAAALLGLFAADIIATIIQLPYYFDAGWGGEMGLFLLAGLVISGLAAMVSYPQSIITALVLVFWNLAPGPDGSVRLPWPKTTHAVPAAPEEHPQPPARQEQDPRLCAVLSVAFPGLGQVYNGRFFTGIFYFAAFLAATVLFPVAGIAVWVFGGCEAYYTARRMQKNGIPAREFRYRDGTWFVIPCGVVMLLFSCVVIVAAFQGIAPAGYSPQYPPLTLITGKHGADITITYPGGIEGARPRELIVVINGFPQGSWRSPQDGESREFPGTAGGRDRVAVTVVYADGTEIMAFDTYVDLAEYPARAIAVLSVPQTQGAGPGEVWVQAPGSPAFTARNRHASVTFRGKVWVIGGWDGGLKNDVWYSDDGVTWQQATASAAFSPRADHTAVVFGDRMWVIGGYDGGYPGFSGDVWYSSDGITWYEANASAAFPPRSEHSSFVFDDRMWVIGGRGVKRTTIGAWNITGYSETYYLNDAWYSDDGIIWREANASAAFSPRSQHTSVVSSDRMWVIGGWSEEIITTANETLPGGARKVSGSVKDTYYNDVWYSSDGIHWEQATASAAFSPRATHSSAVLDSTMRVIGGYARATGYKNDVWSSEDGVVWREAVGSAPFSPRAMHTSPVFDNTVWVTGGSDASGVRNDSWYLQQQGSHGTPVSTPSLPQFVAGRDWQAIGDLPSNSILTGRSILVFNNSLWAIDGNTVWVSDDGSSWRTAADPAAFPARRDSAALVFDNKLWIIGGYADGTGYKNDIWSSADGVRWEQATPHAAFSPRWGHQALAYDNRMWVIGGYPTPATNDVWSSADGKTWTLETGHADFSPRRYHQALVYKNLMWVIGGERNGTFFNDVWSSADGKTWTAVTPGAAFSPRELPKAFVFNDTMWIIGGDTQKIGVDAWYSADGNTWTRIDTDLPDSARFWHQAVSFHDRMVLIDSQEGKVWQSPPAPLQVMHCREKNAGTFIRGSVFSLRDINEGKVPVVRVWEFGDGHFEVSDMRIPMGGGFSSDFVSADLPPGENVVLFQYAGNNRQFEVGRDDGTGQIIARGKDGPVVLFNSSGEIRRKGPGAARDIIGAINDPGVMDTCAAYSFSLKNAPPVAGRTTVP